jgi:hypothetical protein
MKSFVRSHSSRRLLAVVLLSGVFASAGISKLIDPRPLQRSLSPWSGQFPHSVLAIEILLPLLEIGLAIGFLLRKTRRIATRGSLTVLWAYSAFLLLLRWQRTASCGCFEGTSSEGIVPALVRNIVLVLAASIILGNEHGGSYF